RQDGDGTGGDIDDLARSALDDPGARVARLTGDRGDARVVTDDSGAFVVFDDLQTLPAGRAYQLWAVDGPAPVSLGVLGDGSGGAVAVALPEGAARLAISEEAAGGAPTPSEVVAAGTLAAVPA
ncbi:MAG TPA: anti-sigma factor, partial [Acidimicrobiales bacterium]